MDKRLSELSHRQGVHHRTFNQLCSRLRTFNVVNLAESITHYIWHFVLEGIRGNSLGEAIGLCFRLL